VEDDVIVPMSRYLCVDVLGSCYKHLDTLLPHRWIPLTNIISISP
jgi:hypothetical protein